MTGLYNPSIVLTSFYRPAHRLSLSPFFHVIPASPTDRDQRKHRAGRHGLHLHCAGRSDRQRGVPRIRDDARSVPRNARLGRLEGNPEDQLHLYGNAEIRRAGTVLKGDRITYTQETDEVEAVGNARISRQGASFSGPSMRFKISPRTGDMSDAEYEYAPRNIRGCAKNIRFISGESTVFDDAKVTTCKRDDEAWFIKMNELEIDEYDQTATGTNASLHFMGVPVFGSPWFSFPVSRERRSGFLVPTFGMSSTRGLDLAVPYYFNIAPNYDLTLTPRLMTKRGVMLDTEARFLYNNFETTVDYAPFEPARRHELAPRQAERLRRLQPRLRR